MLVFCTVFGLTVEDLSEGRGGGGALLGVEDLRFHRPLYPGATVRARSKVVAKRESRSRPHQGIVSWFTEGFDSDEQIVVSFTRTNLVVRRRA
jgi:acyl dehydratase